MNTPFWLNDPTILFKKDNLSEIWPTSKMSPVEKINAITRLVLLLTLLGYLFTLSIRIVIVGLVTLASIVILYLAQGHVSSKKQNLKESFSNKLPEVFPAFTDPKTYDLVKKNLETPTPENPLMNVLLPEIKYNPDRKGAAPTFNPTVEKEINSSVKELIERPFNDKNISEKLFSNLGDEIGFNRSMRQWYATPNTRIPNDQKGFADFLYGDMISGKEGNEFALQRTHSGAYAYTNP